MDCLYKKTIHFFCSVLNNGRVGLFEYKLWVCRYLRYEGLIYDIKIGLASDLKIHLKKQLVGT